MDKKKLPIGYRIKAAENALTKGIDHIQAEFGLTRIGWQILNFINEKDSCDKIELIDLISPFTDKENVESIIKKFTSENIIHQEKHNLSLTGKGKELHAACFAKQKKFREKVMEGISAQEYETTLSTLEKIVQNAGTK